MGRVVLCRVGDHLPRIRKTALQSPTISSGEPSALSLQPLPFYRVKGIAIQSISALCTVTIVYCNASGLLGFGLNVRQHVRNVDLPLHVGAEILV